MDVVVWLRSLGLEEYEAAFRDNKINERVLPNLTQEDLKELGVAHSLASPYTPRCRRGSTRGRERQAPPLRSDRVDAQAPSRRPRRAPPSDGDVL